MIIGHLLSSTNIRATRNQIRASIVRIDPFGRAPPCDYVNIDDVIDDALIDNDEVDDNHVIVNPIVCPLTPNQLDTSY